MKVYLIVAQRIGLYPGEYAPEILNAITEYCDDENPNWLPAVVKANKNSGEFEDVVVAEIELDDNQVENLFEASKLDVIGGIKASGS